MRTAHKMQPLKKRSTLAGASLTQVAHMAWPMMMQHAMHARIIHRSSPGDWRAELSVEASRERCVVLVGWGAQQHIREDES